MNLCSPFLYLPHILLWHVFIFGSLGLIIKSLDVKSDLDILIL